MKDRLIDAAIIIGIVMVTVLLIAIAIKWVGVTPPPSAKTIPCNCIDDAATHDKQVTTAHDKDAAACGEARIRAMITLRTLGRPADEAAGLAAATELASWIGFCEPDGPRRRALMMVDVQGGRIDAVRQALRDFAQ